jgi:hypothetical protein
MNYSELSALARDLTIKYLGEKYSEGFGVSEPNTLIVYLNTETLPMALANDLKALEGQVTIQIKPIGKVALHR